METCQERCWVGAPDGQHQPSQCFHALYALSQREPRRMEGLIAVVGPLWRCSFPCKWVEAAEGLGKLGFVHTALNTNTIQVLVAF